MKRKVTDTQLKTVEETLKGGEMERVKGFEPSTITLAT